MFSLDKIKPSTNIKKNTHTCTVLQWSIRVFIRKSAKTNICLLHMHDILIMGQYRIK